MEANWAIRLAEYAKLLNDKNRSQVSDHNRTRMQNII